MTDKYKEALQAILEAKQKKTGRQGFTKQDAYQTKGEPRARIKRYKKGGLFDK
ncbi:MAG TPA: hypothetical protein VHS59_01730 [Bacillota bacterium]|nr:hypothetical protein [Bacillota bacterium]